ncbi:MAG: hypothetical protein ACXACP_12885 [Candidatus Hodarchaeales archaeon]|jgi:uncharacterized protein YbgA (DUF1722 family)
MKGIKVYIDPKVEEEFRKTAMKIFGYGKGSLSKAAEQAFKKWIQEYSSNLETINTPEDPIYEIRGQLEGITLTSVELQHRVKEYRIGNQ